MNFLSRWFSDLSPRERRLVGGFLVAFAAMLLFLVPFGVDAMLKSRREDNVALRDAIHKVQASRDAIKSRQHRREAVAKKYEKRAPKLGGFLEQVAKDENIEIPEAQDKPEMPIGKKYVERGTVIRLRKVPGYPLLKMLEKIEQSGYPVAITRLNVRKRGGDHDSYDVELGVNAYDRTDGTQTAPAAPAGSSGTSSSKDKEKETKPKDVKGKEK